MADQVPPGDPLGEFRHLLADPYGGEDGGTPGPTHWPSLPAADVGAEWAELAAWVEALRRRFEHLDHHVIPRCWWRHPGHVEALAALRDHERASYAEGAPATGPLDWLRALRDVGALLGAWTAETGCVVDHRDPPMPVLAMDNEQWQCQVAADVQRRRQREIDQAAEAQG